MSINATLPLNSVVIGSTLWSNWIACKRVNTDWDGAIDHRSLRPGVSSLSALRRGQGKTRMIETIQTPDSSIAVLCHGPYMQCF